MKGGKVILLISLSLIVGINGQNSCLTNEDCNQPYYYCLATTNECMHKDLFPITGFEILGTLLTSMILSLFSIAGLGGGGIVIPFSMLFYDFNTKNAMAISNFTIFACSISRYLYTMDKKHPVKKDCVLIDYSIAIVMMPTVMMGSLLGVFVNILFPTVML